MANRLPPNAIILNMEPNTNDSDKDLNKSVKKQDTLFGPNIGIVTAGPDWTDLQQEKGAVDELTPDIVKNWVAKSKEVGSLLSQPILYLIFTGLATHHYTPSTRQSQTTNPSPFPARSARRNHSSYTRYPSRGSCTRVRIRLRCTQVWDSRLRRLVS